MFKVGDKIRGKKGTAGEREYGNKIFIVETPCDMSTGIDHVCYLDPITHHHNGWQAKFFELVNKEPKNEFDFLDSFKENFKNGF